MVSKPESNFWMSTAYRVPRDKYKMRHFTSQFGHPNEPITTMVVNSLVTSIQAGQQIPARQADSGQGTRLGPAAPASTGWKCRPITARPGTRRSWARISGDSPSASLRWSCRRTRTAALLIMARATSKSGETQTEHLVFNPAGYHHNVIQRIYVEVV